MKTILQVNAAIEGLVGFLLIFSPNLLLNHANPELQGIAIAKLYGMLAFCFGIISYLLSKEFVYTQSFKQVILVVISFHFVVGLYMYGLYHQAITPHPGASVLHIFLSLAFLFIYLKNIQKFDQYGQSTPSAS
ncbi:MAG: hypothetical protein WAU01_07980 [Saprospiraceae bacterium]